jgi:iron complex transport system substrate-binding protein
MAARAQRLIAVALLLLFAGALRVSGAQPTPPARPVAQRIVSLVPAVTEMVYAIGAGPQMIGVSSYDAYPPAVTKLPRVGALIDPDTERILALRPDLVITYGSQSELEAQFARAGIRTFSYRHGGIATVLQSIRDLGVATGHRAEAQQVAADLQRRLDAVHARVKDRPRPRTLLVIERQARSLRGMYVSGGIGFLHEILEAAGGRNVFGDVKRESVQPSQETLIVRAPEVILEVRATGLLDASAVGGERAVWQSLPSLPAVRDGRVHLLSGDYLVVPGPRLAQAAETIARTLHPEAFR